MESVRKAKTQQASELANLSDKELLAWKKAYIKWEKMTPPKDDPPIPSDFAALFPEDKQEAKKDSMKQEPEKKHKMEDVKIVSSKKPKTFF